MARNRSKNFENVTRFLKRSRKISRQIDADYVGKKFVEALKEATPVDTGLTADSWTYEVIKKSKNCTQVVVKNTNIQNGVNVALLLEYGHVSPSGTWVEGAHYIYPALEETYEKVIIDTWKEIEEL